MTLVRSNCSIRNCRIRKFWMPAALQHRRFCGVRDFRAIMKLWAEWSATQMTKLAATDQPELMDGPELSIRTIRRRPQVRPSDPHERGLPRD